MPDSSVGQSVPRPKWFGIGPVGFRWEPRYYRTMGLFAVVGERSVRLWGRRWERKTLWRVFG